MMPSFTDHMDRVHRRCEDDAERFKNLDADLCQLCFAHGEDKRSLRIDCGYAVHEAVPEVIDLDGVEGGRGYFLNLCKSCRAALLGHMREWRNERVALRDKPKDHDGHLDEEHYDPERRIPIRRDGAIVMLSEAEWKKYAAEREAEG